MSDWATWEFVTSFLVFGMLVVVVIILTIKTRRQAKEISQINTFVEDYFKTSPVNYGYNNVAGNFEIRSFDRGQTWFEIKRENGKHDGLVTEVRKVTPERQAQFDHYKSLIPLIDHVRKTGRPIDLSNPEEAQLFADSGLKFVPKK